MGPQTKSSFDGSVAIKTWPSFHTRPFSPSPKLPIFSLKKIGVKPSKNQDELHKRIQLYRNKIVAHSDVDLMRIGFHAIEVGDDTRQINVPHIVFTEGLDFLDICDEWMDWLHIIIHGIVKTTFEFAQTVPGGYKYIKDYLHED
jgi:hypothetical protein